ncbi:MAG: hypothetical protein KDE47_03630 [Caldilineaceae bacterium]|nr:hypothetical protein [Caldilineaceae bacterium]MCB9147331.1 hypothetical protein [Caldilineaceae bacterium]MCB9156380.1 hypothetical protein [Caldilineaceae bacterium]
MIVRNNRQVTRLFFILVLAAAAFGWWYASTHWQMQPDTIALPTGQDFNWIDFIATLGEEAIQLFLGLTGPTQ